MEISEEARRIATKQWRRRQHECHHPWFTLIDVDGRKYGICEACQWICNGVVAEANNRLRSTAAKSASRIR